MLRPAYRHKKLYCGYTNLTPFAPPASRARFGKIKRMNKNSPESKSNKTHNFASSQASWSYHVSGRPDVTNGVRISFETCGTKTSTQISLIERCQGGQTCLKLFLRLAVHFVICRRTLVPNWIALRTKPSPKRGVHRSSQLQP